MSASNGTFLTIGSPTSRRVAFWGKALAARGYGHQVLSYEQVIRNEFPKITVTTYLRITSFGEDEELKKTLLALGGCPQIDKLNFKKGSINPNAYWYKGWCGILQKIANFIQENPLVIAMNTPASIQLAFHKLKSQQALNVSDINTPKIIIDEVTDYDTLVETLHNKKASQVFIKPYHGSSASGVMAYRQAQDKQVLYTTIVLQEDGLYNSLQLQRYTSRAQIKTIVDRMSKSGLFVENWISKKNFQGKSVDFRILVVNNKAAFVVPRMSKHFITNLHLGNEKGNIAELEKTWGKVLIDNAKEIAIQAVQTLGGLFYAGIDVAISVSGKPYILEVNAFGDMLLNIQNNKLSTYEYEFEAWLRYSACS